MSTNKNLQWFDRINEMFGRAMAWMVVTLTVIVFYDVCVRFLFRAGSTALQELEWHIFALIFLLGAASTYRINGHVRVEVLYQKFSPRMQLWVNTLGDLFILLPLCFVIINSSLPFVEASWSYGESSPDPGGLPYRWLIKAAIPAGFVLLALQAIINIAGNIGKLMNGQES